MRPEYALSSALAVLVLLLEFANPAAGKTKKASDYFIICHRNDPDLPGCVKRSIEAAKPKIIKGIPDIKFPPADPLYIPAMELREGQGSFVFGLKLTNLTITGLKDYTVENVKIDFDKRTQQIYLSTPHLHFDADYEMQGRILALPINGKGKSIFDFDDVKTRADIKYRNEIRNGKEYFQIDTLKWNIEVGGAKSNFTNLFNGEKTLGETTNRFLNENWRDAFETYKHLPEDAFAEYFRDLENRFFYQFPVDELYPE